MLLCVSYIEYTEAGSCLCYSVSYIERLEKLEPVSVTQCLLYRVLREAGACLYYSVSLTSSLQKPDHVCVTLSLISSA